MAVHLTESAVSKAAREAKAAGKRIDLHDGFCPGLILRVTAGGGKTWFAAARNAAGERRKVKIGDHPEMGIGAARDMAKAEQLKIKAGEVDAVRERQKLRGMVKDAKEGVGTLRALLSAYEGAFASDPTSGGKFIKSWKAQRQAIEYVFAAQLDKPTAMLTAPDLQRAADAHGAKYTAALAVRCIRPVLKWASKASRCMAPAGLADIEPPATVRRRERVLSTGELRALLPVLRASARPYAAAMRFMLFTLARREEVGQARWQDVDLDAGLWRIPVTKNGQSHVVPLPRQAIALLRARLPADDADGKPVAPDPAGLIFQTKTGAALGNWDRETKGILITAGLAKLEGSLAAPATAARGPKLKIPVKAKTAVRQVRRDASDVTMVDGSTIPTRHDLRRTGATMLGEMGVMPHVIEAALNHVAVHSRLAAVYNQSRYRPDVAESLQRLADKLDLIEAGGAEVLTLVPVGSICG